jgi:hypothetical protein
MTLTSEEIAMIAAWQPILTGFGREDSRTAARIRVIADQLKAVGDIDCEILQDDGTSNYFTLFAYVVEDVPTFPLAKAVQGLLIYLSACASVCVVGRSQKCAAAGISSHEPLDIDMLLAPDRPECHLEQMAFGAVRSSGYEIMTTGDVSQPLPLGVEPFEYCLSPKPWDRVFHALFANTD